MVVIANNWILHNLEGYCNLFHLPLTFKNISEINVIFFATVKILFRFHSVVRKHLSVFVILTNQTRRNKIQNLKGKARAWAYVTYIPDPITCGDLIKCATQIAATSLLRHKQ